MNFLIRTIDFTASGREIVREREVAADSLSVGRASENEIHLPDLAVEQRHLVLTEQVNGHVLAEATGTLGFTHDGAGVTRTAIDPAKGGELGIGAYAIVFDRDEAGRTVLTIRKLDSDKSQARDQLRGFGLETVLPGKRLMAWASLLAILGLFLAIPILTHLDQSKAKPDYDARGATMMDASWRTGALSSVHHGLEDNCEACHVEPFVAVRDSACLSCHEDIADHAEAPRMADGRPTPGGADALLWDIAHAFNKPGPGACTDCHTEHEGAGRMEPTSEKFCADCHDTLDTRLTDTALGNAADFGRIHPEFKALVVPARGAQLQRVTLGSSSEDFGGIKFPHDMHLSRSNGVARMAMRLDGEALDCASCHTPSPDGVRFQPVDMEENCESCHSLVYDRVGSTFRSLSHGKIDQIEADLRAVDRAPRRPVASGRRRPGPFAEGGIYYGNFSRSSALPSLGNALANDGLCGECHYPGDPAKGRLSVLPVEQRSRYFLHGWFDHEDHKQEQCTSCHAAKTSGKATDLLLPNLESCRDCHQGESAAKAEVPSSCAMCHSYHPRQGAAAAPPRIARREK